MKVVDTASGYGVVSRVLHWSSALAVFALFALGWWMVDLGYYDEWYQTAPALHKSVGVLLAVLIVFRMVWRLRQTGPEPVLTHGAWNRFLAWAVKLLLYLLLVIISVSGYLITTAAGDDLLVFDLVRIPAVLTGIDNLEDLAGEVHEWVAWMLIGLGALHGAAALKHHFIDRDATLRRMITGGDSGSTR